MLLVDFPAQEQLTHSSTASDGKVFFQHEKHNEFSLRI